MRVLLVEDDSALAKSIQVMLMSEGYVCDTTDLGEDGLEIGKLYDYDIIVLDLMLPDIDGYEVLRRFRAAKIDTPVLILSGLTEPDHGYEVLRRFRAAKIDTPVLILSGLTEPDQKVKGRDRASGPTTT